MVCPLIYESLLISALNPICKSIRHLLKDLSPPQGKSVYLRMSYNYTHTSAFLLEASHLNDTNRSSAFL